MNGSAPGFVQSFLFIMLMDVLPRAVGFRRTLMIVRRIAPVVTGPADAVLTETTARSVATAAAFYPRRALCLEQSLALHVLLRRRGVPSELKLGVKTRPFYAHAWVEVNGSAINERADLPMHMATFSQLGV